MGTEPREPKEFDESLEQRPAVDESGVDRDAVFKRRAALIASALTGLSLSGCADPPPQPCLSAPILSADPEGGASAAATATGTTTASSTESTPTALPSASTTSAASAAHPPRVDAGVPRPEVTTKPFPHPCLTPVRPTDKR